MALFSERNNLEPSRLIQKDSVDEKLFNRLYNLINNREYKRGAILGILTSNRLEFLLDKLGQTYAIGPNPIRQTEANLRHLQLFLIQNKKKKWYLIYDAIEIYVSAYGEEEEKHELQKNINIILEEEKSAYRMVNYLLIPIIENHEIECIESSLHIPFIAPKTCIGKALKLYADRDKPDYANSIKESISAVESMCKIILGSTYEKDTLGKALKKLKDNGIDIHPSLEASFNKLYGYTCDAGLIRHGSKEVATIHEEDARFILITCSAFVNYLVDKFSNTKRTNKDNDLKGDCIE